MPECQYKRWSTDKPCEHDYFATYTDPNTGKETDYCIFHVPMEAKEDRTDEFWEEFEKLYAETQAEYDAADEERKEKIWLNCAGFVFPDTGNRFRFKGFPFNVNFSGVSFATKAKFMGAIFRGCADFEDANITGEANFWMAIFEDEADFSNVTFEGKADFWSAKFKGEVDFRDAKFKGEAGFLRVKAIGSVSFWDADFAKPVTFKEAEISVELAFPETQFAEDADFRDIRVYLEDDEGERTDPDAPLGVLRFDNAYFHQPERVQIGGEMTDLGQWSFKDTNIEKVNFVNEE